MALHSDKYVTITMILVVSLNIVLWIYNNDHITIHRIFQSAYPNTYLHRISKLPNVESFDSKLKLKQYLGSSGSLYKGNKIRNYPHDRIQFRGRHIQQPLRSLSNKSNQKYTNCTNWAVLTTIFKPSEAVRRFLYRGEDFKWCLVIVGDKEKPLNYSIPTSLRRTFIFLSWQDQINMQSEFVSALPWNSFGRKNIGYLYAIAHGAKVIWDFDDDNMLKFWIFGAAIDSKLWIGTFSKSNTFATLNITKVFPKDVNKLFFNPYPYLGAPNANVWPRGFPISEVKYSYRSDDMYWSFVKARMEYKGIGILQSLADHQPDVDAIYRMTKKTPIIFNNSKSNINDVLVLSHGIYSPMNAQATLHFKSAFFALYLPVTVTGRVSDIWRSYIAQTLLSLLNIHVGFLSRPLVDQDRNPHFNEADFNSEIQLYVQTKAIVHFLNTWRNSTVVNLKYKSRSIEDLTEELYIEIYERGFIEYDDVTNIQMWLKALAVAKYQYGKRHGYPLTLAPSINNVNFSVGRSTLKQPSGIPKRCIGSKIRSQSVKFWTSDLHDGTRLDVPTVLTSIGQEMYIAGIKGTFSPYPYSTSKIHIYTRLSDVIKKYKSHSTSLNEAMIKQNKLFYQNDSVFMNVDACVCSFPSSMCELWMPFNKSKSIIFLPAHRYNLGRCTKSSWLTLNRKLIQLVSLNKAKDRTHPHVIAALSRYDYEYMKYYTGITSVKILSSFSGFYTQGHSYKPIEPELLVFGKIPKFAHSIKSFKWISPFKKYNRYSLDNLVSHPAIIYFTYSVMSYKFTEFYSLNIPMFIPSATYFRLNGGLGSDRTSTSPPYCDKDPDLWRMPKNASSYHSFNPNAEFKTHPEDEMYWLQFSDFYDWPYVQFFDNKTDLEMKVKTVNFTSIHEHMKAENEIRKYELLTQWCDIILKITV